MKTIFTGFAVMVALTAGTGFAQTAGQGAEKGGHDHVHGHKQDSRQQEIYKGYFPDAWIEARALSDWEGDWQSVFPLLESGALDPVMAQKAEHGDKSAAEYRAYYEIGYRTDIDRIEIDGGKVTFHGPAGAVSGQYVSDGHEVLTYAKGNRGVRFIFRKAEGDTAAPGFIQFSDHIIAPAKADHYHLYWGDDRAALLSEVTNWPTYYPTELSAQQIVEEMLAH